MELQGKYYSKEADSENFFNEFHLEIKKINNQNFYFTLEMTTHSEKGIMGYTWKGKLVNRLDHLKMIIDTEIDWVKNKKDNSTAQNTKQKTKILDVEIYPDEEKILIYNPLFSRYITLDKVE